MAGELIFMTPNNPIKQPSIAPKSPTMIDLKRNNLIIWPAPTPTADKIPISDLRLRTLISDRNAIQIPPATIEAEMILAARVQHLFPRCCWCIFSCLRVCSANLAASIRMFARACALVIFSITWVSGKYAEISWVTLGKSAQRASTFNRPYSVDQTLLF